MVYGGFGIYQPASFWTQEVYDRVGGLDPTFTFAADTDLFVKFALFGARFKFLRHNLVAFRVHENSKTTVQRSVAKVERDRILALVPQRSRVYKWSIRTACRAWKILCHLIENQGRYLIYKQLDKEYRFVP
jgi:hypothetical protein